jgi:undecaprenyl-diphosphatase
VIEILKAFLYGLVEGITEWLPISSTGHLILLESILPFSETGEGFFELFDVVIQLGAILAVVVLFFKKIWPFALTKAEREAEGRTGFSSIFKKDIWILWGKILLACIPAVVIGVPFDDDFERLFYNPPCVAVALIVFGIAFIVVENRNKDRAPVINDVKEITCHTALLIGIFQVLAAIFPGVSRSGATIVGALLIGVSRTVAAEFTFYLAIPVMFGASLLKCLKYEGSLSGSEIGILLTGTLVAFVVSLFALRFLMGYVKRHDFKVFGWYRIALGVVVLLYFCLIMRAF